MDFVYEHVRKQMPVASHGLPWKIEAAGMDVVQPLRKVLIW